MFWVSSRRQSAPSKRPKAYDFYLFGLLKSLHSEITSIKVWKDWRRMSHCISLGGLIGLRLLYQWGQRLREMAETKLFMTLWARNLTKAALSVERLATLLMQNEVCPQPITIDVYVPFLPGSNKSQNGIDNTLWPSASNSSSQEPSQRELKHGTCVSIWMTLDSILHSSTQD